jgi:hypothetical protein
MKRRADIAAKQLDKSAMARNSIRLFMAVTGFAFIAIFAAPAKSAVFPQCHDVSVEKRILNDYDWAETRTWYRGIKLLSLSKMHEHKVNQNVNSSVVRRYCMATGHLSNGHQRSVYYLIENVGGFVGKTWNVTHCVVGLDHWRNHDGNCRALR